VIERPWPEALDALRAPWEGNDTRIAARLSWAS
jgi:hypothetical protein